MEAAILNTLLHDENMGWLGWVMIISVVLTFGIGLLTRSLITIAGNVKALKKLLSKTDYKKQIRCENNINEVLRAIRHELFAERVVVIQYHNGIQSIANNSLLKLSVTHESLDRGIKSMTQAFQSIPSNYLGTWNKCMFDGRYVDLPSLVGADEDPDQRGIVQFLSEGGVKSVFLFPIEDSMGNTFGIGMVQFMTKESDMTSKELNWARHRFSSIGALLAGPKPLDK